MAEAEKDGPPPEDPRVRFAAERTLLAWIRTGLGMMGFGFVAARFGLFLRELAAARQEAISHHGGLSLWIGVALVVLGVAVTLLAARRHAQVLARIDRGEPYEPPRWSLGVVVAVVLALIGACMAAYLLLISG
jgi:putative membrane protein